MDTGIIFIDKNPVKIFTLLSDFDGCEVELGMKIKVEEDLDVSDDEIE